MVRQILANRSERRAGMALLRKALARPTDFAKREDGGMMFMSLVILMLMLFLGGMAIDLMRYESMRTRVQATADAAALAAASMRQTRPPVDVVNEWFARTNLSENLTGVVVDESVNHRSVRVDTRTATGTYFMHMLGVDQLQSSSRGRATEAKTNVEISLVLDISGSMNSGSRAANLRSAAREFIDLTLRDDTENRIAINIVPYNGQVMLGSDLWNRHTKSYAHSLPDSTTPRQCLDFPQSAYGSAHVPTNVAVPQSAYADTFQWAYTEVWNGVVQTPPNSFSQPQAVDNNVVWCTGVQANRVRVMSNARSSLLNTIDGLVFTGATSIDAGFKWGASLLDPASRPMIAQMAASGQVPSYFSGRPYDYDDEENLKIIVLMTDGEHFAQEVVNNGYREGQSPIWRRWDANANVWRYVIHHPSVGGTNQYYAPHLNNGAGGWVSSPASIGTGTTRMDWRTLWRDVRMKWVAWQLYARPLGGSNANSRFNVFHQTMDTFRTQVPVTAMDQRLNAMCTEAKNNNILIFGIAFEAPQNGINAIRNCASPDRFYDVDGLDIATAFRNIRSQISALRLSQ